jgi:hypothetical protein
MHAATGCIDDRESRGLAIALLDEVDRLAHVDDVFDVLRPQQQHTGI